MTAPQLFTLEQANALVPLLEPVLLELQAKVREVREQQAEIDRLLARPAGGNGHLVTREAQAEVIRGAIERLSLELEDGLRQVQSHGCEVKDLERGLVDFRSLHDGRVVYLCWQLGETEIAFWHDLDAGFRGRQAL